MSAEATIQINGLSHFYGTGALRKQILFEVQADVKPGEIVIMTGPSGSGKTTLLTLIGALRSVQEGSLCVLGRELYRASRSVRAQVRRGIGYIFQAHNLLGSITAVENVEMALQLHRRHSARERRMQALQMLEAVGLEERAYHYPHQLSGGQKQRVAIARALVTKPRLILADEPTAALDKQSGREVVDLMYHLAKGQGCTVLLVTHDNRILDVADRIIHMEDGQLSSFTQAVLAGTQRMLDLVAMNNRNGELTRQIERMPVGPFASLVEQLTRELENFLNSIDMLNHDAFDSMLDQVIEAFTFKVGQMTNADRATLFLLDAERGELWSKVARDGGRPLEIRIPASAGIAGHVISTGCLLNVADAYDDPRFHRGVDERTGYRTRSVLCVPIFSRKNEVVGVIQLLNKRDGTFDAADEQQVTSLAVNFGIILESWTHMRSLASQRLARAEQGTSTHPA
ncbi:MAG: hypothetical protein KatS3mg077_0362 [Candidatus Binatia bacterium]|nr:MAG: hypothetical protein KatS3mg077_0362 [Candidatus Binatia bacterium]